MRILLHRGCIALSLVLSLLIVTSDAFGRGKFRIGTGVRLGANVVKNYGANVLSVHELRTCVSEEIRLDQEQSSISEEKTALGLRKSELEMLERTINFKQAALNRYSQADIDSFNRLVDQYNSQADRLKVQIAKFNQRVGVSNSQLEDYNRRCSGKQYYEDDLIQARQGLNIRD